MSASKKASISPLLPSRERPHVGQSSSESRYLADHQIKDISFSNLGDFLNVQLENQALYTIFLTGLPLAFYVNIIPGSPLIISFSGALPSKQPRRLPFFSGIRMAERLSVSLITFSDPALHLDEQLRIGWYGGTKYMHLQQIIPLLLQKIVHETQPSTTIFQGGSAGGFAALYFSKYFPASLCLTWNPQINLLSYSKQPFNYYCRVAFGLNDRNTINTNLERYMDYDLSMDVTSWCTGRGVLYLQCSRDKHVQEHLLPLLTALDHRNHITPYPTNQSITPTFRLFVKDWGVGHQGPPRHFILHLLRHLLRDYEGSWMQQLKSLNVNDIYEASKSIHQT